MNLGRPPNPQDLTAVAASFSSRPTTARRQTSGRSLPVSHETSMSARLHVMAHRARVHMPTEVQDTLLTEIAEIVQDTDLWLDTPNERFGGQRPRALLRSEKGRAILHDLVQAVKHGMVT